jgi:hypothetical protein
MYGVNARNAFKRARSARGEVYYTFGLVGFFGVERGYEVVQYNSDGSFRGLTRGPNRHFFIPPAIGTIGIGAQRHIAAHLAVRADLQAVTLLVFPFGVRASVGVAVPLGSYADSR